MARRDERQAQHALGAAGRVSPRGMRHRCIVGFDGGTFHFLPGLTRVETRLKVSTEMLIMEGVRRLSTLFGRKGTPASPGAVRTQPAE